MNKGQAHSLKIKALEVAVIFSDEKRAYNNNNETFVLNEIIPLSENTACVVYEKTPSNKRVAFFFFYINMLNSIWFYYCPTDSHIIGMESFGKYKLDIERFNYQKNFEKITEGVIK